jgi:hypothetical protein
MDDFQGRKELGFRACFPWKRRKGLAISAQQVLLGLQSKIKGPVCIREDPTRV